jgi:uncharacterized membrane protein YfcA
MVFEIASFSFTLIDLGLLLAVAALVGMAKTGLQGAGMIAVPMLALVFGAKSSTGVMLPILIFADLFGVYYYNKHANWQHLKKLLPFAFAGVILGTITGNVINETVFAHSMIAIIFVSLGIMIWRESNAKADIIDSFWFVAAIGIAGGFTTMVGNLAGPVMALYLLSMQLPKNQFIGTAAWFFLIINLLKMPFHIWVWETITWDTVLLNTALLPAIAIGAVLGISIVKKIPEAGFRWFVIIMTAASALAMML